MIAKKFVKLSLLALSGVMLASSPAHAVVTTSLGDLFLNFRTTDTTSSYNLEVDLGPASYIASLGVGTYNFNVGNYLGPNIGLAAADLTSVFSTVQNGNWNTLGTLVWSVAGASGAQSGSNTVYVTSSASTLKKQPVGTQKNAFIPINAIQSGLNGATSTSGNLQSAQIDASDSTSYSTKIVNGGFSGIDYNYTGWGTGVDTEAGVLDTSNTLNFFVLASGAQASVTPKGYFTLGNDGSFTYTVVPEPSTTALLGMAAMVTLFFVRRRRQQAAAR